MQCYMYCRVGNKEQLKSDESNLRVLAKNKVIDEINKKLRSGTSYHTSITELLRKE